MLEEQAFERVGGARRGARSTCASSPRPTATSPPLIAAGRVPRGPVLPPQRHPDRGAAAARAPGGHPGARRALRRALLRARTASGSRRLDGEALALLPRPTTGRATCASCATWSSGSSSWCRRTPSAPRTCRRRSGPRTRRRRASARRRQLAQGGARRLRARLHPGRAARPRLEHDAHRRAAGHRAQPPLPQDPRLRHHAAQVGSLAPARRRTGAPLARPRHAWCSIGPCARLELRAPQRLPGLGHADAAHPRHGGGDRRPPAAAMMGTPPNRALLAQAGLLAADGETARARSTCVIAVVADRRDAATDGGGRPPRPRSPRAGGAGGPGRAPAHAGRRAARAARRPLALISVPGAYAGRRGAPRAPGRAARDALQRQRARSRRRSSSSGGARARSLLLMGPDCGTAIVGGVPLGLRQRRAARPHRPRGGLRHRAAGGDLPAGRRGRGRLARDRRRRPRPLGRRRRRHDARRARRARRRCRHRSDRRHRQAARPRRRRRVAEALGAREAERGALDAGRCAWCRSRWARRRRTDGPPGTPRHLERGRPRSFRLARGTRPAARSKTRRWRPSRWRAASAARGRVLARRAEIERLVAAQADALPGQRFVRGVYSGGTLAWEAVALLPRACPGVRRA